MESASEPFEKVIYNYIMSRQTEAITINVFQELSLTPD